MGVCDEGDGFVFKIARSRRGRDTFLKGSV